MGADAARRAAEAVNGLAVLPGFEPGDSGTDWNDKLVPLHNRQEARAQFEAGVMMAQADRFAAVDRERTDQAIDLVQRTPRHASMDGIYEARVLIGHSPEGYHHALHVSRQGGEPGAPAWSAAMPTQDAALAAGQAAEQQWFETYDTEQGHAVEQEIGM